MVSVLICRTAISKNLKSSAMHENYVEFSYYTVAAGSTFLTTSTFIDAR